MVGSGSLRGRPSTLPPFVKRLQPPRLVRRVFASLVLKAVDSGWTPRVPLETHLVICGFPRAGTTLLALMLQASYPDAKGYPRERDAIRVAYLTDRNSPLLVSKRPDDVFYLDAIRTIYESRRARVRFLLTMRDPRAVLTSVHAARAGEYYVSPERWRATYRELVRGRRSPDCLVVRFEDLVTRIGEIQRAVAGFLQRQPAYPFDRFADHVPPNFKQTALNGLRALDPSAASKWRAPRHRARISALLDQLPELPQVLVDEGYERDAAWADAYRSGAAEGTTA